MAENTTEQMASELSDWLRDNPTEGWPEDVDEAVSWVRLKYGISIRKAHQVIDLVLDQ